MQRFVAWRDRGANSSTGECCDIGSTTNATLERFQRTSNPAAAEAVDGLARCSPACCAPASAGRQTRCPLTPPPGLPPSGGIGRGDWRGKPERAIQSSGYVVHTLEAAFWAVEGAEGFEQAILAAVNLGDDADTVGAVAGQIAGARWGLLGIPARWRERLHDGARIRALAQSLYKTGV